MMTQTAPLDTVTVLSFAIVNGPAELALYSVGIVTFSEIVFGLIRMIPYVSADK